MCITALLAIWGFWLVWQDNAIKEEQETAVVYFTQGDNYTSFRETTVIYENYLPVSHKLSLTFSSFRENKVLFEIEHESYNVQMYEVQFQLFYGNKPLIPPNVIIYTENSSKGMIGPGEYYIPAFSSAVVKTNWSYTSSVFDDPIIYISTEHGEMYLSDEEIIEKEKLKSPINILVRTMKSFPFKIVLPIAFFVLFGVILAKGKSRQLQPISESLFFLTQLRLQHINEDTLPRLETTLKNLAYVPNLFGYGSVVAFALAFWLLRTSFRKLVIELLYKSKLESLGWENSIEKYIEATKPSSAPIDLKSIALIIGILASVGITFSWNLGAIKPVLLTIGLTYLCYNLGFLLFVVRKSPRDMNLVFMMIVLVAITLSMPDIINIIRYPPY